MEVEIRVTGDDSGTVKTKFICDESVPVNIFLNGIEAATSRVIKLMSKAAINKHGLTQEEFEAGTGDDKINAVTFGDIFPDQETPTHESR